MTALPHLQSLTPGNCLFNFLFLCLIFYPMFYFLLLLFLFYLFFHFLHHLNFIKCSKPEIFKSICNKFKSCHCIWFCMLLLHFGTPAYLFSPEEGLCYVFSTQNNYCEFLAISSVFILLHLK